MDGAGGAPSWAVPPAQQQQQPQQQQQQQQQQQPLLTWDTPSLPERSRSYRLRLTPPPCMGNYWLSDDTSQS